MHAGGADLNVDEDEPFNSVRLSLARTDAHWQTMHPHRTHLRTGTSTRNLGSGRLLLFCIGCTHGEG
jgi:hypothetical protein